MTMRAIQHIELFNNAATLDITNIPAIYDDLLIYFSLRTNLGPSFHFDDMGFRINGDTGSNYTRRVLRSREGGIASFSGAADFIELYEASAAGATANTFGNGQIYIPSYRSPTAKIISMDGTSETNNSTLIQAGFVAASWSGTAPVQSIRFYSRNSVSLVPGSSATIYGITRGSFPGVTVS